MHQIMKLCCLQRNVVSYVTYAATKLAMLFTMQHSKPYHLQSNIVSYAVYDTT